MALSLRALIFTVFALSMSLAQAESCTSWLCSTKNLLRGEDAFMALRDQERALQEEALKKYSGDDKEILERLALHRKHVADTSYRQTLRLCWAYRAAWGMELNHPSNSTIDSRGNKYTYSMADSLAAWAEIYGHGLYQPIDGMFGSKADYIEIRKLGFFNFESWFKSLYAIDFVSSTGFLYGAVHCLNTTNSRDIQLFAAAILAVDYEATLTTEVLGGLVIGKLAKILNKTPAVRWALRPLKYYFNRLKSKITKPMLVIAGVPTSIILADNLSCKFARQSAAEKAVSALVDDPVAGKDGTTHRRRINIRINTVLRLTRAFNTAKKQCDAKGPSTDKAFCDAEYTSFIQLAKSTKFNTELNAYKKDQLLAQQDRNQAILNSQNAREAHNLYYCNSGKPSEETPKGADGQPDLQQAYLDMLDILLPLVESLNQAGRFN